MKGDGFAKFQDGAAEGGSGLTVLHDGVVQGGGGTPPPPPPVDLTKLVPDARIMVSPTFADSDLLLTYSTITAALVSADALVLMGKLPLIEVYPGTYEEDIIIGSGILIDFRGGQLVGDPSNPATTPAIEVEGDPVILTNFTIPALTPKDPFIKIDGTGYLYAENILSLGAGYAALRCEDGGHFFIINSELAGGVSGSAAVDLGIPDLNSEFRNCLIYNPGGISNALAVASPGSPTQICSFTDCIIGQGKVNFGTGVRVFSTRTAWNMSAHSNWPDGPAHIWFKPVDSDIVTQDIYGPHIGGSQFPPTLEDALTLIQGEDTDHEHRISNMEADVAIMASYMETGQFGQAGQIFSNMLTEDYSDDASVDYAKSNNAHIENDTCVFEKRASIDDFESYADTPALAAAWVAYAGSGGATPTVALNTVDPYKGAKAMTLGWGNRLFSNTTNGGVKRTLPAGPLRDWSDHHLFRYAFKASSNLVQLRVILTDGAARTATSPLINVQTNWTLFDSPFSSWSVTANFDWTNVVSVDIREATLPSQAITDGDGAIYIDEIINVGDDLFTQEAIVDDFEANPTDWVAGGVTSIVRDAVRHYHGASSVQIVNTVAVGSIGKDFPGGIPFTIDTTGFRLWMMVQSVANPGNFLCTVRLFKMGDHSQYADFQPAQGFFPITGPMAWFPLDFLISVFNPAAISTAIRLDQIDRIEIAFGGVATPFAGTFNLDYFEAGQFGKVECVNVNYPSGVYGKTLMASAQYLEAGALMVKDVSVFPAAYTPDFAALAPYVPGTPQPNLWNIPQATWMNYTTGYNVKTRVVAYKRCVLSGWSLTWR